MIYDSRGRIQAAAWAIEEGELTELRETDGNKRMITEGGLPELNGSPDDVEAARDVRSRILVDADDILTRLRSDETITDAQKDTAIVSPRQVTAQQVHSAEIALNRLRSQADAA